MSDYIVKKGDNPWKIAKLHNIPLLQLLNANNLTLTTNIYAGLKLVIPNSNSGLNVTVIATTKQTYPKVDYSKQNTYVTLNTPYGQPREDIMYYTLNPEETTTLKYTLQPSNKGKNSPKTYTIKKGDTLTKIAKDNGMSLSELIKLNKFKNKDVIHEGDVIVVDKSYFPVNKEYINSSSTSSSKSSTPGSHGGGRAGGAGATGGWKGIPYSKESIVEDTSVVASKVTFNQAFAEARRRGDKTFQFDGKTYTTEVNPNLSKLDVARGNQRTGVIVVPVKEWSGIQINHNL